jgi:hypothetical protein
MAASSTKPKVSNLSEYLLLKTKVLSHIEALQAVDLSYDFPQRAAACSKASHIALYLAHTCNCHYIYTVLSAAP